MGSPIGRGWLGSIRKRADFETRELSRTNPAARRARYGFLRRALRGCIGERSIFGFLLLYAILCLSLTGLQLFAEARWPGLVPAWQSAALGGRLKDIGGYLIAAQVGLLAIVSVAIGVVSLIVQSDDRSATNVDVRLYYTEALAYELIASAAAFLVVLCVQLFWPFQYGLYLLGDGAGNLFVKTILTAFHVGWGAFNTLLFAQFLLVTLRFVEPTARNRMRRRYTANVIVPSWNRENLLSAFYMNAPKALLHEDETSDKPYITFGYGFGEDGIVEIASDFPEPAKLYDVWSAPLGVVLRRWAKRSTPIDRKASPRNVLGQRIVRLIFRLSVGSRLDGHRVWVIRLGGTILEGWERWLIRWCFRFRKIDERQERLPTPTELLEQLHENTISQIARLAQVGFRSAYFEAIEYHRFLLEIQNTVDDNGAPLNFSQIGGFFQAPHEEWVHQYRRVIEKAVEKIGIDDYFVHYLSRTVYNLLPESAAGIPEKIMTSLLQIGAYEVILLERWFTQQTNIVIENGRERRDLPGSSQRVYSEVVQDFVGAWEDVVKSTDTRYDWPAAKKLAAADYWKALGAAWPFMREHLHHSAYFVGAAVWNEDSGAAQSYRDMLVRWADWLRFDNQGEYYLQHRELVSADLLCIPWEKVRRQTAALRVNPNMPDPVPDAVFGLSSRSAFSDVLLLTAAAILRWHMDEAFPLAAQVAADLIHRRASAEAGSRLSMTGLRSDPYLALWELLVRAAASDRHLQGNHKAWMDDVVRRISGMTEGRMISGRVYSSSSMDGLDQVYPQFLAIMVGLLPDKDTAAVIETFRSLAQSPDLFAERERVLDRVIFMLDTLKQFLESLRGEEGWQRGVRVVSESAPIETNAERLSGLFTSIKDVIRQVRMDRLVAAPIDQRKLDELRDALERVILQKSIAISCFHAFSIELSDRPVGEIFELPVGTTKSFYSDPPMEDLSSDYNDQFGDAFSRSLSQWVWANLWSTNWDVTIFADALGSSAFWDRAFEASTRVGPDPAAIVPSSLGDRVMRWRYTEPGDIPPGRHLDARDDDSNSGLYAGYAGTLDGMYIYNGFVTANEVRLFSRSRLRTLLFHRLADGHFVNVRFEQGQDPHQSKIIIQCSISADWRDDALVRLLVEDGHDGDDDEVAVDEDQSGRPQ